MDMLRPTNCQNIKQKIATIFISWNCFPKDSLEFLEETERVGVLTLK